MQETNEKETRETEIKEATETPEKTEVVAKETETTET